ncbi:Plasma-membrane choline transporter and transmembrane domain-containing protein [Spironucleus salmonicida]|uniref:Choline transporter-like protein n=1 Tax=Spironucleus salmonicida TaxID=348837 RepID=V6LHY4_9EUKA|nr:Plasma-membrane choline transporter and transmembrane domain-containing protein [Spironucleus salmonicida]|eukprot:EST44165.1 Plasma-membrane choline transporter and transmembrane domain-containing protein [Spironucleus salmonicida]
MTQIDNFQTQGQIFTPVKANVAQYVPSGPESPAISQNAVSASPIMSPKQRKFRDVLCSIIFMLALAAMLGSAVFYKLWTHADQILLIIRPADQNRRVCGLPNQPDFLATDYSRMLSPSQVPDFCQLIQKLHPASGISCDLSDAGRLDPTRTRTFFRKIRPLRTDFSSRAVGFAGLGGTVCMRSDFDCQLQPTTEVLCSADFVDFAGKIDGISAASVKSEYPADEFQAFLAGNPKYTFLSGFCVPVQKFAGSGARTDYELLGPLAQLGVQQCVLRVNLQAQNVAVVGPLLSKIVSFVASVMQSFAFEVKMTYLQIIYGLLCGIAITAVYLVCLRFIVKFVVYGTIIAVVLAAAFGAYYFISLSLQLKISAQNTIDFFGFVDSDLMNKANLFLALGIVIAIVGGLVLLFAILCFKGIRVGIAVIASSVDCMRKVPNIFFIPIFFVVIFVGHLVWTGGIALMYYLSGNYDARGHMFNFTIITEIDGVQTTVQNGCTTALFALYVFMVIWGSFFIHSCLQYMISFHVAYWYFSDKRRTKGVFKQSILCVIKNMGTLLVASFITSLVVFIRMILEYVLRRLELSNKIANSKIIKAAFQVARCCLKCLQKVVEWINRNVVIYSAITGVGYFKSLGGSMKLTMGSFFTSMSVKFLSWIFLTFAKLLIAVGSGVCTWAIIRYTSPFQDLYISGSLLVSVLMFIISYYTVGIVQLTIDSIYMCYLYEDSFMIFDREKGLPVFAPKGLANLLQ